MAGTDLVVIGAGPGGYVAAIRQFFLTRLPTMASADFSR